MRSDILDWMLTKADDYPIHQTPEPIAFAGTDRNFYDRYFFNGYSRGGETFFAAALGVYPHLNVMDAAFSIVSDGVQHNLHASKELASERMDTVVGPIRVDVVEPLDVLRVTASGDEHGIACDLTFRSRTRPIEEPRFVYRNGPRTVMDYTRLTQSGRWEGWIEVADRRIEVDAERFWGTRDRSWGVRPVGAGDPQPVAPPPDPQFFWLWSPLNFEDRVTFFHDNADADGRPWNRHAVVCADGGEPLHMAAARADVRFRSGCRHAESARLVFEEEGGAETIIELEPKMQFYMAGIGYLGSEWGHGQYKGELAVGYDRYVLADVDEADLGFLHVQALCSARMTTPDGQLCEGGGVLEQLIIGPHAPSGFREFLDPAP
jgi:hypothetical protein